MDESVFDPTYGGTLDVTDPYDSYYTGEDLGYGADDYSWMYGGDDDFATGTILNDDGTLNEEMSAVFSTAPSELWGQLGALTKKLGPSVVNSLKKAFTKNGDPDWASIVTAGIGAYNLANKSEPGGYSKPVPKMEMVREQIQYNDPNRRPGEAGRQYFTDPRFATQGDAASLEAAKTASAEQAAGLQAAYQPRAAEAPNPYAGKMNIAYNNPAPAPTYTPSAPASGVAAALPIPPAQPMAQGGIADAGRYLQGKTDGMADEIETSIDGDQPALLSHGEFVIPADVVSHLGNGNSEAGADKLYAMMDRIREARTGTTEQGKEIDADKFLAAAGGGLMAAYAGGGEVKRFDAGGTTGVAPTTTAAPTGVGGNPLDTSKANTLSPWVGDYVTNALGQGAALANAPYQAYQGPLTAGASGLQQQAFAGASELSQAGYTPGSFGTGLFDANAASQYMNPYLSSSLAPQLQELQRQNTMANMDANSKLTKAGAYGGSRQAVMNAENQRNMLDKTNQLVSQGYNTAYDKATAQYNADQGRQMDAQKSNEASRQFGADFGLKSINQLAGLGETQRGITSEGMAADQAQFEDQRDFAYKMPQYQLNLLANLPIGASTSSTDQDLMSRINSTVSGMGVTYKSLQSALDKLGQTSTPATP